LVDGHHVRHVEKVVVPLSLSHTLTHTLSLTALTLSVQIHGKNYLMDDLSIECYTPTHTWYQSVAVVGVVLYPVGIPLAFLFLLYRYKVPMIARHKRRCHALRRVLVEVYYEAHSKLPLLTR
jgi:hypothetical protein